MEFDGAFVKVGPRGIEGKASTKLIIGFADGDKRGDVEVEMILELDGGTTLAQIEEKGRKVAISRLEQALSILKSGTMAELEAIGAANTERQHAEAMRDLQERIGGE